TGVSAAVLSVSVPALTIGLPVSGSIGNGQDLYFRLTVPPAQDVMLSAEFAVATGAEVYVRYGALPDRTTFDHMVTDLSALHPPLSITNAQGGDYYLLLHGREGAAGGTAFTLHADAAVFGIDTISPRFGSNRGQDTISLFGTRFTRQTTARL